MSLRSIALRGLFPPPDQPSIPTPQGNAVPNRKEIQWSQLKVGALVLVAMAVLIGLIFLMSGSSGGLFSPKLKIRAYFDNAEGLKNGAPVTLEGVTIGSVTSIRVVPDRNPTPVEVTMQLSDKIKPLLHTDSTTSIAQAGVLGDSFVDITSEKATGPEPANGAELKARNVPSIQAVVDTSQEALQKATVVMDKVNTLLDTLNSKRGTLGDLINDPALYKQITQVATNLQVITQSISQGKGTLGKLMTDEAFYNKINTTVDRVNTITSDLADGKGTAGKLLHDETLYNNLNATVANTNQLVADINSGKGGLGKIAKDPEFARKLDDTVSRLDSILTSVDEGKGTLGQLLQNRSVYDHADQTLDQAQQLIKGMREDPKKYLVIRVKLF